MYDVTVGWHNGREKEFENVEAYSVVLPPAPVPSPNLTYSPNPAELVLTGGSWQEVHIPIGDVAFWFVTPAGT